MISARQPVLKSDNTFTSEWFKFFSQNVGLSPQGGAVRPTAPTQFQTFFDTNLGIPIWCTQVTPTVVWVNSTGAPV